ncbi:hypothetical protein G8O24_29045 [Bradyrhizobium sp. INPA01-394B]|jgi:hypothetical protein|uniref:Mutator family transposase n=1 Tax=Bradyrhizobium campsiandrae TaxID=1729892 RepID=A0ABR7UJY0_9BRAD|nr:hypothetical protein [Bradyrhizobium campsiandrae]MBC9881378.1 hypothetical protein [Bradyrhizobium campsiandrae]MBC9983762.1 hypothetical protein [Bradyrhizobium campsiandrae]
MRIDITTSEDIQPAAAVTGELFDNWFGPIETSIRAQARGLIEGLINEELELALARPRYGRLKDADQANGVADHRHGSRRRTLTATFGKMDIAVPRARLVEPDGRTSQTC